MNFFCLGRLLAVPSVLLVALSPALADAPGVLWQTTSQMVMPGVPFSPPPNTVKFCAASEWTQPPPPPPGQTCTQTNFQRDGNKVSWDSQCTGEMEMTGHGEITFESEDKYTGEISFAAEGMKITMNLTGEKIGECDNPVG
jgi:hypothetical protein